MRNIVLARWVIAVATVMLAAPVWGQGGEVRAFFDWYAPLARDWYAPIAGAEHKEPVWSQAYTLQRDMLAPSLASALRAEWEARGDEKVKTLDFDPFTYKQAACESYKVGKTTKIQSGALVEVFGVCGGKKNASPDLVVELVRENARWVLIDIRYPNGNVLTTMLRRLRAGRRDEGGASAFGDILNSGGKGKTGKK